MSVNSDELPTNFYDVSGLIPKDAIHLKLVMGTVVDNYTDYYKPVCGHTYLEMLRSHKLHQWSPDGINWTTPSFFQFYGGIPFYGGSARNFPNDGRLYLSFWGTSGANRKGGCCGSETNSTTFVWGQPYELYYATGILDYMYSEMKF